MRDPRIDKLARTLVRFSTQVRDGDNVLIQATDADRELVKALIEEVYRAGGKPFVWLRERADRARPVARLHGGTARIARPRRRDAHGANAGLYRLYRHFEPR